MSHFSKVVARGGGASVVVDCACELLLVESVCGVAADDCGILWSVASLVGRSTKKFAVTAECVECGASRSMSLFVYALKVVPSLLPEMPM